MGIGRAIGQGLTPITEPAYGAPEGFNLGESSGRRQASAGPFGLGGSLSDPANDVRRGLSRLLFAEPESDTAEAIEQIGMPGLGGSSVSTAGTGAVLGTTPQPRAGGLSALVPPEIDDDDSGLGTLMNLQRALQAAGLTKTGLNLGARSLNSPGLGAAGAGLGAATGLAGAGLGFSQGEYAQAIMSLLSGLGQASSAGSALAPAGSALGPTLGATGGALGAAGGLAGGAYGLSQGDASGGAGIVSGIGALANLAPAGWTLGGVPIAAAGAGGAGAGAGTGASLASLIGATGSSSIAGASTGLGLLFTLGILTHLGADALFAEDRLPFGEGWSAHNNLTSQKSKLASEQLQPRMLNAITETKSAGQLLNMAAAAAKLSPHGEIKFVHQVGQGGEYGAVSSPEYWDLLQRANTGDPGAIREFLSGLEIVSGESGVQKSNYLLTDYYKRQFVSLLPQELQAKLGNLNEIFGATPQEYLPNVGIDAWLAENQNPFGNIGGQTGQAPKPMNEYGDVARRLQGGEIPFWQGLSPHFRDSSETSLSDEQRQGYIDRLNSVQAGAQAPDEYTMQALEAAGLNLEQLLDPYGYSLKQAGMSA